MPQANPKLAGHLEAHLYSLDFLKSVQKFMEVHRGAFTPEHLQHLDDLIHEIQVHHVISHGATPEEAALIAAELNRRRAEAQSQI